MEKSLRHCGKVRIKFIGQPSRKILVNNYWCLMLSLLACHGGNALQLFSFVPMQFQLGRAVIVSASLDPDSSVLRWSLKPHLHKIYVHMVSKRRAGSRRQWQSRVRGSSRAALTPNFWVYIKLFHDGHQLDPAIFGVELWCLSFPHDTLTSRAITNWTGFVVESRVRLIQIQ